MALETTTHKGRQYGLDILRAAAIISVLLAHGAAFFPEHFALYQRTLNRLDGVNLFFILSGYLIGGILMRTLERDGASWLTLRRFWFDRWGRTLPPYYLALLLVMVWGPVAEWRNYTSFFGFVQNLNWPHPAEFQIGWSLSVEEWFYLLTPPCIFLLIWAKVRPRYAVLLTAILILVGVTGYRYLQYIRLQPHTREQWDELFRKIVLLRLDALMYGVLAAYAARYHHAVWSKFASWQFAAGAALLVFMPTPFEFTQWGVYENVFYFNVTAFASVLLLPFFASIRTGHGIVYRILTHVSLISYSLYLLHATIILNRILLPAMQYLPFQGKLAAILGYGAYWVISILAATLMYHYFEVPVIRYRDKIRAKRKPAVATTA